MVAQYGNVRLRPLEEADIERLRQWRNDTENTKYIRQVGHITPDMQKAWFSGYLQDPDIYTFAIDDVGLHDCVGSVSLYNFRGSVMEFGKIMVGDARVHGTGLGRMAVILDLLVGFALLGATEIDAVVHADNIAALIADQKAGFSIVGRHPYEGGGDEMELLVKKADFFARHHFLREVSLSVDGEPHKIPD